MKKWYVFLLAIAFSCNKKQENPAPSTPVNINTKPVYKKDTSSIFVSINQMPMDVQIISYERRTNSLHMKAANSLQQVDVFTFNFWGNSGFNYQCQDTITYAHRADTLSGWLVETAPYSTSSIYFDCCAFTN